MLYSIKTTYYTVTIINRHSEGVAIKVGFEYLKTIVASYELRTPAHMNGNETSSNEYCLLIPLSCDPSQKFLAFICRPIFVFFAFFCENKKS